MPLQKWVRCVGEDAFGERCSNEAKFIGIIVEEDYDETEDPVCDDHANGYERLRYIDQNDVVKHGIW